MKKIFSLLSFLLLFNNLLIFGQYNDYVGAGHTDGITVMSSDNWQQTGWSEVASAEKTINGAGLEGKLSEAARFLSQAAISHDMEEMEHVAEIGIEAWIEEQISQPYTLYLPLMEDVLADLQAYQAANDLPIKGPGNRVQKSTWWRMNMEERDFLRDKITLAWSEIMVISTASSLNPYGDGIMDYLDIFKTNAFGNFIDILREVTLHQSMGFYLSHHANAKADTVAGIYPDENYAREIMQLFTIGLHQLNNDGTPILDDEDNLIPTYTQNDITEMAKVFTGLGAGDTLNNGMPGTFNAKIYAVDFTEQMQMYEAYHEASEKSLFDGDLYIPPNQTGMEDIEMVLDYLVNHPNTAPFICQRLIQLFVKSNPTPAYVDRVATIFKSDENGNVGNMEAVFKAILLDEEARTCDWQNDQTQGKFKNPTEKAIQFTKIIDIVNATGEIWTDGNILAWMTGHNPFSAPSVFNFHERDYAPNGQIADESLVAPEFQTYNPQTSVGYGNLIHRWIHYYPARVYGNGAGVGQGTWQDSIHTLYPVFDEYLEASQEPEVLINKLDLRMTNGNLSPFTRGLLKDFLIGINEDHFPTLIYEEYNLELIKHAIVLLMMSPDFNILK